MSRFLRKAAPFAFLQVLILALVLSTHVLDPGDYYASIRDKEDRLQNLPSPRMIFVGGSSVAYTLDSERVQRALGANVVNMGVSMHLGLNYILRSVPIARLRPGDTVVLNLEYEHFGGDPLRVFDIFHVLKAWPGSVTFLDGHAVKRVLDEGLVLTTVHLRKELDLLRHPHKATNALAASPYRRNAFDPFGDGIAQLDLTASLTPEAANAFEFSVEDAQLRTTIDQLNNFAAKCAAKRVCVVLLYPAYPSCLFQQHKQAIDHISRALNAQLRFPVLNTPEESLAPVDWFYDHPYHLKRHGVEWRTASVIAALAKVRGITRYTKYEADISRPEGQ